MCIGQRETDYRLWRGCTRFRDRAACAQSSECRSLQSAYLRAGTEHGRPVRAMLPAVMTGGSAWMSTRLPLEWRLVASTGRLCYTRGASWRRGLARTG